MSSERYEIKGKIGQGGVGAVYRAYDLQLNRDVAIKRVLPDGGFESEDDATKHLLKEATSLSSIQHPHIVTVYDSGVDEDGPYVVMELLDGRTIEEMVERSILTLDDFKEVALQSQEALIAAQDLNLVHRDLKPSNVMVTWLPSGRFQVKIVDFGLAKFSPKPSLQTIDHGDSVFGSIFFMAPEQFERSELDQRTDMYAIGCVYYFCLTGQYPFDGETAAEVMEAHLNHEVKPVKDFRPDIPEWVNDWIMWHINRDMVHRPKNARAALESFLTNDQAWTAANSGTGSIPQRAAAPQLNIPGGAGNNPSSTTAPQAISPKGGRPSVHTSAQQAASAITSAHAVSKQSGPVSRKTTGSIDQKKVALPTTPSKTTSANVSVSAAPSAATAAQALKSDNDEENAGTQTSLPTFETKKGLSGGTKVAIAAVLAGLIVIVGLMVITKLQDGNRNTKVETLADEAKNPDISSISVSKNDIEIIIDRIATVSDQARRDGLYNALYKAEAKDDTDIDSLLRAKALGTTLPKPVRLKLLDTVLHSRKDKNQFQPLADYVLNSDNAEYATAAMKATEFMAEEKDIDLIISVMKSSRYNGAKKAAEQSALRLIERSNSKGYIANKIVEAYSSESDLNTKYALIRLMGPIGGTKVLGILKQALQSEEGTLSIAALTALGSWPADNAFDLMIDHLALSADETQRSQAQATILEFLKQKSSRSEQVTAEFWKRLGAECLSEQEKLRYVQALGNTGKEWALPLIAPYSDPAQEPSKRINSFATKAAEYVKRLKSQ